MRLSANDRDAARARADFFPDKAGLVRTGAPPYRIAVDTDGCLLRATLSLIGYADAHRRSAFDAFIAGLCGDDGIVFGVPRRTLRFQMRDAQWTRIEGIELQMSGNIARLDLVTPLRIGTASALGTRFGDVIVGLARQVKEMARWTGVAVHADLSAWRDLANRTPIDSSGLHPVVWDSFSSINGRDRAAGYMGNLRFVAPTDGLWALLLIGEALHAGGAVAKGYGRYRLSGEAQ